MLLKTSLPHAAHFLKKLRVLSHRADSKTQELQGMCHRRLVTDLSSHMATANALGLGVPGRFSTEGEGALHAEGHQANRRFTRILGSPMDVEIWIRTN